MKSKRPPPALAPRPAISELAGNQAASIFSNSSISSSGNTIITDNHDSHVTPSPGPHNNYPQLPHYPCVPPNPYTCTPCASGVQTSSGLSPRLTQHSRLPRLYPRMPPAPGAPPLTHSQSSLRPRSVSAIPILVLHGLHLEYYSPKLECFLEFHLPPTLPIRGTSDSAGMYPMTENPPLLQSIHSSESPAP